jgi:hypothetical protein
MLLTNYNKEPMEDKGLGDTIARVTHATGIDRLAEKIAAARGKSDCGCKRRQEYINRLISYKKDK